MMRHMQKWDVEMVDYVTVAPQHHPHAVPPINSTDLRGLA